MSMQDGPQFARDAVKPRRVGTTAVRIRLTVRGAVQGVGFRPFVYRLATELGLHGWVYNSPQGVFIEVEGERSRTRQFQLRLHPEKPPRSFIQSLECSELEPAGYTEFTIRASDSTGEKTTIILPDIATCPECLREINDPSNRRYQYPFTNCTNCGPRYSIIEGIPYDRANTSMKSFPMCPLCQAEHDDPASRRFHAQPNACPECGPQVELWDQQGCPLARRHAAVLAAAEAIHRGSIVAVKGIGGFHLLASAYNPAAVQQLRDRKHRDEKPFALMFPDLQQVKSVCECNELEERLLQSAEAPIVLLRRKASARGLETVAPGNPYLGVMLPYSPLHHLLFANIKAPAVATSGNISDEPICTDEREAVDRLRGIADVFLVHNRPIVRHVDDSIARVMLDRELILRRARGYAPLPITLSHTGTPVLAAGAHLKNNVALAKGNQVFISQHIGDLETVPAFDAFRKVATDFQRLYESNPSMIAADLHPDYLSSGYAQQSGRRVVSVQHHLAHVLSCMAENEVHPPLLGIAWDGTGLGTDGTIWGGEFFLIGANTATRIGCLRRFRLPGGERAVREPRRSAFGALHELFGEELLNMRELPAVSAFSQAELSTLKQALQHKINAPESSSVGRLFDAVSSIAGLRHQSRFEGQAAMDLEFLLPEARTDEHYVVSLARGSDHPRASALAKSSGGIQPVTKGQQEMVFLDWHAMIRQVITDVQNGIPNSVISLKFHNALAYGAVLMARHAGIENVVLSGGCFQNRYLTEKIVSVLREAGFRPHWHQRVPPNDGGIALGQIIAAQREKV